MWNFVKLNLAVFIETTSLDRVKSQVNWNVVVILAGYKQNAC